MTFLKCKNSIRLVVAFVFTFLFVFAFTAKTKAQWSYTVAGTVKKNKKKLEGAVITLYRGSTQVNQIVTQSNGRFSINLDQNAEYSLTIGKAGHITKKFYFNTKGIPEERAKEPFGGQDIEVSIFEMPKDPGVQSQINNILSQPMAKFYYDDKIKEIDYDKAYSQSMQDALAKLAQVEKEANAKAEEESKKQQQLEAAAASQYQAAIAKGDAAFAKKDYVTARAAYEEALSVKKGEQYPLDKIKEIEKLQADAAKNAQVEADYKAAIAKADAAFTSKNYDFAKTNYNDALKIKPTEAYPKTKIAEIDGLLAKEKADKELNDKYNAAVAKGDAALGTKNYAGAKAAYNEALALKGAEKYPKDKIAEIDKLLADAAAKEKAEKELNDKYNAAIAKGDAALAKKDYAGAKAGYNEAIALKSAEKYPKDKIVEIDKLLADIAAKEAADKEKAAKEKELNDKYTAAIAKGDKALAAKDYTGAKAGYNEAIGLKATEQYPKDKIKEIDGILADIAAKDAAEKARQAKEKELNDKYNAAIAKGDAALATKNYAGAKTAYAEATTLKTTEQYPKDKLAEIEKLLADAAAKDAAEKDRLAKEKELNDKYNAAMAKGDKALAAKNYEPAKAAYNEALTLKPNEQLPKDKIASIDKILADLAAKDAADKEKAAKEKELNEKYKAAVAKGDKALLAKDYDGAKAGYNEALGVKPAEAYPKTKLAEIDKALADAAAKDAAEKARQAKEKELAEKYDAAVKKGDDAFGAKDYAGAKAAYTEASTLKPAEKYPKDKITEINAILAKEMGAKELEKKYNDAIAKGDAALASKDYATAKTQYNAALALKANEQYPKDKLAEVEKALADANAEKDRLAKEKELNAKYAAAVAKGDAALKAKTYEAAKTAYNEASTLKPGEQYPKDKIDEINKLLAEIAAKNASAKELDEKYKAAVAKADAAFAAKDYSGAKAAYNEALSVKATEKYPKDKIAAIDAMLANEANAKEKEEKYKAAITKADEAFAAKDYSSAKSSYTEASTLKPTEQYPKDQLVKVNDILSSLAKNKAVQDKYDAAVKKADDALANKEYATAIAAYKEAQTVKPTEPYPSNKISEINKTLEGLEKAKAKEKEYLDLLAKGDKLFASKDYKLAKSAYQDAMLIKASDPYPKAKIAEIDNLMKKGNTTTTATTDQKKEEFKNALAEKYPEGITEETARENNAKVTRRIVVKGKEGHLYIKKETNFGPVYYFKDDVPITEQEYLRDTEVQ